MGDMIFWVMAGDRTDRAERTDQADRGRQARLERAAAAHGATAEDVADRQVEPSVRDLVDPFLRPGDRR